MEIDFVEYDTIKEDLCIKVIEHIYQKIQDNKYSFTGYKCKDILKDLHIGPNRFQRILNCIYRNWVYFKIKHGYIITVSNIVMTVDDSRRYKFGNDWAYFIKAKKLEYIKSDV